MKSFDKWYFVWNILRWFTKDWWRYLLEVGNWTRGHSRIGWPGWTKFWCRIRGHKCGVWWFNPNALEPDMHCKNCDDDLG